MEIESSGAKASEKKINGNGRQSDKERQPRVVSHPKEVEDIVMMQIDAVSVKKDELTIAIKNLTDTTKQLARAYGQQAVVITKLQKRIAELESTATN